MNPNEATKAEKLVQSLADVMFRCITNVEPFGEKYDNLWYFDHLKATINIRRAFDHIRQQERERAAAICDAYGREGDRTAKEYACETADELAAQIRNIEEHPE